MNFIIVYFILIYNFIQWFVIFQEQEVEIPNFKEDPKLPKAFTPHEFVRNVMGMFKNKFIMYLTFGLVYIFI